MHDVRRDELKVSHERYRWQVSVCFHLPFFGITYHLNSAPFLRLHRRHCQSQDMFICLLYPSPPGPSTQNYNLISSNTPTLTHLIISSPHLNNTHTNRYSVPS